MKKKLFTCLLKILAFYITTLKSLFSLLNKNFDEIIVVNTDNLKLFKKKGVKVQ